MFFINLLLVALIYPFRVLLWIWQWFEDRYIHLPGPIDPKGISKAMQESFDRYPDRQLHPQYQAEHEQWHRRVIQGKTRDDA